MKKIGHRLACLPCSHGSLSPLWLVMFCFPLQATQVAADSDKSTSSWLLQFHLAAGGDTLGSLLLTAPSDDPTKFNEVVREELHAGDALSVGGSFLLPFHTSWSAQFSGGLAWGAAGLHQSGHAALNLSYYYWRTEFAYSLKRWRFGGGLLLHTKVRYKAEVQPSVPLSAAPGLRVFCDYAIGKSVRLGFALQSLQYRLKNVRDYDAGSKALTLSLAF